MGLTELTSYFCRLNFSCRSNFSASRSRMLCHSSLALSLWEGVRKGMRLTAGDRAVMPPSCRLCAQMGMCYPCGNASPTHGPEPWGRLGQTGTCMSHACERGSL